MPRHDLRAYIEARIERGPGCWTWTGSVLSTGYGLANLPGRRSMAHRVVYELLVGEIPPGLVLDHQCHNRDLSCRAGTDCRHRRCVNPGHLTPATVGDNTRNGHTPVAANLAKTTCPRGHVYDRVDPVRGWRKCRTCLRERERRLTGKPCHRCGGEKEPMMPRARYCRSCAATFRRAVAHAPA